MRMAWVFSYLCSLALSEPLLSSMVNFPCFLHLTKGKMKTIFNKKYYIVFLILFFNSCKKEKQTNPLFNESGTGLSDSVMDVMKEKLEATSRRADSIIKNKPIEEPIKNSVIEKVEIIQPTPKYIFTVLTVREVTKSGGDWKEYENRSIISEINDFSEFNDDVQARFEDKMIQTYKMGLWSGTILNKETFVFESYSKASKKRNTYIIE